MPLYNYTCADCGSLFVVRIAYSDLDTAHPTCPDCGGDNCARAIGKAALPITGHSGQQSKDGYRLTKEQVAAAAGMARVMTHNDNMDKHDHHHHDD